MVYVLYSLFIFIYAQIFAIYFSSHFKNTYYMLFYVLHSVAHFNYITLIYLLPVLTNSKVDCIVLLML